MRFSISQAEIRRFVEEACAMECNPAFTLVTDKYGNLSVYHRWYTLQPYDIDSVSTVEADILEALGIIHEDEEDPDVWDFTEDDKCWGSLFEWLNDMLENFYTEVLSNNVDILREYNDVFGEDDRYSFGISR